MQLSEVQELKRGIITAIDDAGSGKVLITCNNTLVAGEDINIQGTTNYDGHYITSTVTATSFKIKAPYVEETPSEASFFVKWDLADLTKGELTDLGTVCQKAIVLTDRIQADQGNQTNFPIFLTETDTEKVIIENGQETVKEQAEKVKMRLTAEDNPFYILSIEDFSAMMRYMITTFPDIFHFTDVKIWPQVVQNPEYNPADYNLARFNMSNDELNTVVTNLRDQYMPAVKIKALQVRDQESYNYQFA